MNLFGLILFLVLVVVCSTEKDQQQQEDQQKKVNLSPETEDRSKRQLTTTTPRPKKRRPSNFFSLVSQLISETRNDTRNAANEIGTLFNSQFAPPNTTRTTPTDDSVSPTSAGDSEDGDSTTTTEPYRVTRDEFMEILRLNVRGLVNLFGKELRNAIRDSNKNVREFGKGFRESLRPYVTGR